MEAILNFWFEGVDDQTIIDKKNSPFKNWFRGGRTFDESIRAQFATDLEKAQKGEYKSWEEIPRGRLALVILFDQFSRNIYRNTPKMYATDPLALELSLRSIEEKMDYDLQCIERLFLYMPLMHAENLEVQTKSVECFKRLVDEAGQINSQNTGYYEYHFSYTQKHFSTIKEFGHFPHRKKLKVGEGR